MTEPFLLDIRKKEAALEVNREKLKNAMERLIKEELFFEKDSQLAQEREKEVEELEAYVFHAVKKDFDVEIDENYGFRQNELIKIKKTTNELVGKIKSRTMSGKIEDKTVKYEDKPFIDEIDLKIRLQRRKLELKRALEQSLMTQKRNLESLIEESEQIWNQTQNTIEEHKKIPIEVPQEQHLLPTKRKTEEDTEDILVKIEDIQGKCEETQHMFALSKDDLIHEISMMDLTHANQIKSYDEHIEYLTSLKETIHNFIEFNVPEHIHSKETYEEPILSYSYEDKGLNEQINAQYLKKLGYELKTNEIQAEEELLETQNEIARHKLAESQIHVSLMKMSLDTLELEKNEKEEKIRSLSSPIEP